MARVKTVTGAPAAAAYVGTWMRNPNGLNAAKVSRDALAAAAGSRKLLRRLVLAATCTMTRVWPTAAAHRSRASRASGVRRVVARIAAALAKPRPRRRQAA